MSTKWGPIQKFGPHEYQVLNWGPLRKHWIYNIYYLRPKILHTWLEGVLQCFQLKKIAKLQRDSFLSSILRAIQSHFQRNWKGHIWMFTWLVSSSNWPAPAISKDLTICRAWKKKLQRSDKTMAKWTASFSSWLPSYYQPTILILCIAL